MNKIAETSRLLLREFTTEDAHHFYDMNSDPLVLRYTGDPPFKSKEEAFEFVKNYDQYERFNYGRWAVIRKEDDAFLGWCGLKYHPDKRLTEVGFRFYRKYWGEGYATEAARSSINYGFAELGLPEIHAHVHKDNQASVRVLEKLGMVFLKPIEYDGMEALLYVRKNPYYNCDFITAEEARTVRHSVLRKGLPYESAFFDEDNHPDTFHIGMYFRNTLTGVLSMIRNPKEILQTDYPYQLRGMAVLERFRKRGLGGEMVNMAEEELRERKLPGLWLNAREKAIPFYRRLGYEPVGEIFDIPVHGPHLLMKKDLE
ncbi:GNAT family N-acetyltransferase [Robertkochia aurantiaca]|uniref:GNAT family N-acetyltransferase n=1 Tax=Robertkochia aurantiaca TaxID=2873700 RepID=UPI001CCB8335|nr:GNAT family N-acetyltransferase [Robertkochia sp. 3YJGBD-33]